MSFDLDVWYEPWPVTGPEARSKLDHARATGDDTAFIPHPNVRAFHTALLERFPAHGDGDSGVWSVAPDPSDRYIGLCMLYSAPSELIGAIVELAEQSGLVVLDPQDNSVYLPPALQGRLQLEVPDRPTIDDPDPDVLAHQVRKTLAGGGRVTLRRSATWCLAAEPIRGGYALEHEDGTPQTVYRHETADLNEVAGLFEDFHRAAGEWATPFGW